jgi:quercetin dioxygenase-like cupin family protein
VSVRLRTMLLLAAALVLTAAASAYATTALHAPAAHDEPVVRTVLAEDPDPAGAAGRTLGLSRVTVAPGAELALHRHPGTQIATVQQGTLTYWVVRGSVTVKRGEKTVRTIGAGQRGVVRSGDWIVERPGTIHHAANQGRTGIVILIASLFTDGAPPSIAVKP